MAGRSMRGSDASMRRLSCRARGWVALVLPFTLGGCFLGAEGLLLGELAEDEAEQLGYVGLPCEGSSDRGLESGAGVSFNPEQMLCVQLTMEDSAWQRMRQENRFGVDNEEVFGAVFSYLTNSCTDNLPRGFNWYTADVVVEGVALEQVGVRKKGFLGSVYGPGVNKPSLKLKTDRYVEDQRLGDTERITLNNNNQDGSRMRTCLGYGLFAAAGYPAPRCNLASVMVNGTALGAYSHVEALKKRFLRRAFGDDSGSLYEGTLADFSEGHLAGFASDRLGRWEAKTDATDPEGRPIQSLYQALQAPDEELLQALEEVLNLERFIRFWALETLINHSDGYAANRNNFFIYFDPSDGDRGVFVPWGTDNVMTHEHFGEGEAGLHTVVFAELPRRLSRLPETAQRFEAELRRLLDEVWDEESLLATIELQAGLVRGAEQSEAYDDEVETLRAWVSQRRQQIEAQLSAGLPPGSAPVSTCEDGPGGGIWELVEGGLEFLMFIVLSL